MLGHGPMRAFPTARALRAIIAYKTAKACLQLAGGLLLAVLWPFGLPVWIHAAGIALGEYATHGWAVHLAERLLDGATRRGLELAIAALFADGALTALEAWALATGRWWGPWLVVAALGLLLPWEVFEFVRAPAFSRAALFALNLAMATYLARRAWREHRERVRAS